MTVDVEQVERIVALVTVGVTVALQRGQMTTAEAGHFLFSPHTMALLRTCGARNAIVELIHTSTELEDIESIIPEQLDTSLQALMEDALVCVGGGGEYNFDLKKWLATVWSR